jgi:hypothetical protein
MRPLEGSVCSTSRPKKRLASHGVITKATAMESSMAMLAPTGMGRM